MPYAPLGLVLVLKGWMVGISKIVVSKVNHYFRFKETGSFGWQKPCAEAVPAADFAALSASFATKRSALFAFFIGNPSFFFVSIIHTASLLRQYQAQAAA